MKRIRSFVPALAGIFVLLLAGCSEMNSPNQPAPSQAALVADGSQLALLPTDTLAPGEQASLLYMREEEKLARDIYLRMYERWNVRVFNNIRQSEETHMSAILTLLTRYTIPDPVGSNGIGVFVDPNLQELYNQLIVRGSTSLTEALAVGVLIEQTDIADLAAGLSVANHQDIVRVYTNLLRASQNHLAAFTTQPRISVAK